LVSVSSTGCEDTTKQSIIFACTFFPRNSIWEQFIAQEYGIGSFFQFSMTTKTRNKIGR
jgi:hypothetical protein